jgi:hypothetical protein
MVTAMEALLDLEMALMGWGTMALQLLVVTVVAAKL